MTFFHKGTAMIGGPPSFWWPQHLTNAQSSQHLIVEDGDGDVACHDPVAGVDHCAGSKIIFAGMSYGSGARP